MRELSAELMQALFARETTVVTILLLTVDHELLDEPFRVTSDAVSTVSRGNTFTPFPFKLTWPEDNADADVKAQLTIDNVSRALISMLRQATQSPPSTLLEVVKSTALDTVEIELSGFEIKSTKFDVQTVTMDLVFDSRIKEQFPAGRFTPGYFPNVHA